MLIYFSHSVVYFDQGGRRRNREEFDDERERRRHSSPGRGRDWSPPPHKRLRREPWYIHSRRSVQYCTIFNPRCTYSVRVTVVVPFINPRRACAARVTVVGSVCVLDLPSRMSNRAINKDVYLAAYKCQNFEGIRLKRLRSGVTAQNTSKKANMLIYRLTCGQLSPHDAGQGAGGCRAMIKSLQPCSKRYLLMQLARVAP